MHTTHPLLIGHGYRSQHISHGSKHLICSSLILLQSLHSSPTPSKSFPPIIPLSCCDLWSPTLTQSSSQSLSLCPLFLLSACFLFLQLLSHSTLPQFGAEPPQPALFYPDTQETSGIWITDPEREDHFSVWAWKRAVGQEPQSSFHLVLPSPRSAEAQVDRLEMSLTLI